MNNLEKAVVDSQNKTDVTMKTRLVYDKTNRIWRLCFVGWDEQNHEVEFQFEREIKGLSMYLVQTKLHNHINVGVWDVENGEATTMATSLRLPFPNFWPKRDPHQMFDDEEVKQLIETLIREANVTFFQELANGWRGAIVKATGADNFELEMVVKPKEVLSQDSGEEQPDGK